MNKQRSLFIAPSVLGLGLIVILTISQTVAVTPASQPVLDPPSTAAILETYGQLPLSFESNQGQTDDQVKFLSRGSGYNLFLTSTEAVLTLRQVATTEPRDMSELTPGADVLEEGHPSQYTVLRLQLIEANPASQVMGLEELSGKVNYFLGNEPAEWRTDIPSYAKVAYQDVYPGVDLIYYGNQGQLEYDFVVTPGADPARIALGFAGANSLAIDAQGDLALRTSGGEIRQRRPFVYQELDGVRHEIAGRYVLTGQDQVRIEVEAYDASRPLVIDPVLVYSTYLGGSGGDGGVSIAVDKTGNVYVTGATDSSDFPTTTGAFDTTFNSVNSAFVTKLNSDGTALVYSTFLGGSFLNDGRAIAVDSTGNAYVTGRTFSDDFPTTTGAFDTTFNGFGDAYVTKLNPDGSALVYSTYLGGSAGSAEDNGRSLEVDSTGNAYVTGETWSSDFPTTPGAFDISFNGFSDTFVAEISPDGSALVYSTFLGGSERDVSDEISLDSGGDVYVTGQTLSGDFPTTVGAFDTSLNGGADPFVTKLNPDGSALVYSTFLGGSDSDSGQGTVDSAGNVYMTGITDSSDFPTTAGAFDTSFNGGGDAFVTKLNPDGSALVYSTFLGGSERDGGSNIELDSVGNAYVTGNTPSTDFPTTPGAFDTSFNGGGDIFITKLNPDGSALVYSTFLGGSSGELGTSVLDSTGNVYVVGATFSGDFPTTAGAFDTSFNGGIRDAFIAKLNLAPVPTTLVLTPATATNPVGTQHCVIATVIDVDGNPVPNVIVRFTVTGAVSIGGTATTDASGQAQFCYNGPAIPGADSITAYIDTNADNAQDPGEPFATATKTWTLEPCTILDDFNRPDGPLGSNWDGHITGYRIKSNQVTVRPGGPIYWQPEAYGSNQEACVTLSQINIKSRQHGLLLKVQQTNNWRKGAILVSYNGRSGNVEVKARNVTTHKWVLVGSFTPPMPVVDGDQLRAKAFANGMVEAFINNGSLGTADAGSFYANKGGQIGLWFRARPAEDDDDHEGEDDDDSPAAKRARLDDFGGGTIITASALSCLDLQTLTPFPQTFPGPTFSLGSLNFTNPVDLLGMPMSLELTDRPEDLDGKPELSIGFSSATGGFQPLSAEFPSTTFPSGVKDVSVELRHFASAAVLAFDNTGAVISTATQPTQNVRVSLSLPGSGIRRLQFNTVEMLLYKICWIP